MDRETTERCWCCNAISSYYETATVLGRHKVRYYCCRACGFIQTEPPFWLAEIYKSLMPSYDLGGISRPTLNSILTKAVINWWCLWAKQKKKPERASLNMSNHDFVAK